MKSMTLTIMNMTVIIIINIPPIMMIIMSMSMTTNIMTNAADAKQKVVG